MKAFPIVFGAFLLAAQYGCSDEAEPPDEDHVWKEHTQAIDEAKQVEDALNQAAGKQRKAIEEQSE